MHKFMHTVVDENLNTLNTYQTIYTLIDNNLLI